MNTSIKVRTELRYPDWRSYTTLLLTLFAFICLATTTTWVLTPHPWSSAQNATSVSDNSQQLTYRQFADRYKDPSLSYFLGE